jgi:predicted Zn-dependent protease
MATLPSRRAILAGGLAAGLYPLAAQARIAPASMQPLTSVGYRPVDVDEKGLWQACDPFERELARSNLLVPSPALHDYTIGVVSRLLGDRAREVRAYIVRDPDFNASMAPNGMLMVHTGLLVRARNEAHYAAVLGHEAGHYLRRHSVAGWRDRKLKTGAMAFITVGSMAATGATARAGGNPRGWIDLANSVNRSLALSIYSFSREQESEADAFGVRLMAEAGYPPAAAAEIWRNYGDERRASAATRGKRYRDFSRSALSTHPATDDRMLDLNASAREIVAIDLPGGGTYDDRRAAWDDAVGPLRPQLLDEQVKLNDPGASLYLIEAQAAKGWDGVLRFYQGEVYRLRDEAGDDQRAATAYAAATALPDAPAEAWRAHGYALLKAGRSEDGRSALARYLSLKPAAGDAAMIRFSMGG